MVRTFVAALGIALILLGSAAAQQAVPPYEEDALLFLHRDSSLDALAPTSDQDATFAYGPMVHETRFESPELRQPWVLRGPGFVHLTFQSQISVLGRFTATLDIDGVPFARSNTEDFLVDVRPKDIMLTFTEVRGEAPVGSRMGITLEVVPLLTASEVGLTDLLIELVYDSTAHPSALQVLGRDGVEAEVAPPGAQGPAGINGRDAPTNANTTGNNGNGGDGRGGNDGLGEPLQFLAGGPGVDPFLVMAGVGTSAVTLLAGLVLRGRLGLG